MRKIFNNIYVKDYPENWDEEKLWEVFGRYGNIKSLVMIMNKIPGTEIEASFSFICFEDPKNKDYGPICA